MQQNDFDDVELCSVYKKISVAYWRNGLFDLAEDYCLKALEIEQLHLLPERFSSLNNLAKICTRKKDYSKAIEYYSEVLKEIDFTSNPELVCTVYDNIAQIFIETKEYDEALIWCKEAFDFYSKTSNTPLLLCSNLLNSIGFIYYSMGKYDDSITCYKKAIEIRRRLKSLKTLEAAGIFHNLGIALYKKEDYKHSKEQTLSAVYLRERLLEKKIFHLRIRTKMLLWLQINYCKLKTLSNMV